MSIKGACARQRGLSLVELIVFIVIVSIAVLGILQVFSVGSRYSADPVARKQALLIAESLMEEVQLAKFTYCDPSDNGADVAANAAACTIAETVGQGSGGEPVGSRPFDNVNDYVSAFGVAQTPFTVGGNLTDANGTTIDVQGYSATLAITPEALNGITSGSSAAAMNVLRIAITVTNGRETVQLDGYRTRYAPTSP